MGIRIDGAADLINATDGSLTIEGQSVNTTGIITASGGMKVGSAATIHSTGQFNIGVAATIFPSGNATFAGIITATGDINATGNLTGAQGHFTDHIYIADTICHTGDTNTKIRFPTNDNISCETGGVERLRIGASGGVGLNTDLIRNNRFINIAAPSQSYVAATNLADGGGIMLQGTDNSFVSGRTYPGIFWSGNTASLGRVRAGILGISAINNDATDIAFLTRSAQDGTAFYSTDERMRIRSDGRIGIGTTNTASSSKVTICGTANNQWVTIRNTTASDSSGDRLSKIIFQGTQSGNEVTDLVHLAAMHDGGADDQNGAFRVYINDGNDGSSPTERFGIGKGGEYRVNSSIGSAGQVIKSAGSGSPAAWGDAGGGIDTAYQWRTTADATGNQVPITSWEKVDTYGGGGYGDTDMVESSGIFTFPSTGFWLIKFQMHADSDNHTQNIIARIDVTTDNSSYAHASRVAQGIYDYNNSYPSHAALFCEHIFDVTSTTNCKVRFSYGAGQGGERLRGSGTYTYTGATFIRLGDT
tara:strand:+ start:24 stop:1616 length:1593 start_codon:yes stop_codon:yes gene_type:complete